MQAGEADILPKEHLHFQCDRCGLCCQRVGLSSVYKHLDRGDGICRYYEDATRKCSIYDERPLICNVEGFYEQHMKGKMSREQFFALNYDACRKLKEQSPLHKK